MSKMIIIDSCGRCPKYCELSAICGEDFRVTDPNIIPDWCPLPNAPAEYNPEQHTEPKYSDAEKSSAEQWGI